MTRRLRFKPTLKQALTAIQRVQEFYEMSLPPSDPRFKAAQQRANQRVAAQVEAIKIAKPRAAPRQLEAPVVAAISELLAQHPKVLFAVRQNSGMASYEAKSGRYAPVHFYRILTHGKEITLPDFWGILRDGRMLAVEAKAPSFTKPRTEREMAQANFLALIRNVGGIALFATSADQVAQALE